MSRPELQAPPEIFYNEEEARKYTRNSRIMEIQSELSHRALELLALPDDGVPRLLLDIGCGSGLSGDTLSESGHQWIGLDISQSMLDVALENEVEGDLLLGDMGQGLGLRSGIIDGAISISAVQWLCNADKSSHNPRLRLKAFFGSLYRCLARGARAAFQVYPENLDQRELILSSAMRAGFAGASLLIFPTVPRNERSTLSSLAVHHLLLLLLPKGKGEDGEGSSDDESSEDEEKSDSFKLRQAQAEEKQKTNKKGKGREWILKKKEQMRKKGNVVPPDTKYTARKRKSSILILHPAYIVPFWSDGFSVCFTQFIQASTKALPFSLQCWKVPCKADYKQISPGNGSGCNMIQSCNLN